MYALQPRILGGPARCICLQSLASIEAALRIDSASVAMQVLCPPAPQGCELQKEEVRTHKPAAHKEEDQVEQQRHAQHAGPAAQQC
jgi:hypothetical protein